tara:strand:- start:1294 stop:1476 length:183 start_codon:yes stop_codon:yes gene_type:complete
MALVKILIARLREPSTMAGLGAILAAVGINVGEEMMTHVVTAVGALAGVAGMLLREKGDS